MVVTSMSVNTEAESRILQPGSNCWCLAHARRLAFLIDGAAYFSALRAASMRARQAIFILGWDVDSRMRLPRSDDAADDLPETFGEFLNALARRRPHLQIHVLDWDFAMLFALDREVLPLYQPGWRSHRRVHFHLDSRHPVGASHHQKIVVIDDALAFVGGLDITHSRWDTPDHDPDEPRRVDVAGEPYAPFHDVQLMVEGDVAAVLGQLARERWRRATGRDPRQPAGAAGDPWPDGVTADLSDVEVAVARTEPAYQARPAIQEIKRLYLDAIAAARHSIYIENQYLTAPSIGEALAARLQEREGPEIILISRFGGTGWLETNTMEMLRARFLRQLQAADRYGRLRAWYPDRDGMQDGFILLHSKLMVVDDRFVRIGSANLNNRSMGLDTECDLAIESGSPRVADAISGFRDRLLAEHLGMEVERVRAATRRSTSLIGAIEGLNGTGNSRRLSPLQPELAPEPGVLLSETALIDPEQPVDPEVLVDKLVPPEGKGRAGHHLGAIVGVLLVAGSLAAAWRWTPLSEWVDIGRLVHAAQLFVDTPAAPLWVLGTYLLASLVAFPITLLVVATALLFGPVEGFVYALAGSLLGAGATFGIGHLLGRATVRRLAGTRLDALSRRLSRRGLLAVLAVRLIPVAPFTVVNIVAGATHIRLRDFLAGTVLGMTPGILAVTVFSDRILAALYTPSLSTLAWLSVVIVLIGAGAFGLQRWLQRHTAGRAAARDAGVRHGG
jgi:phospholipase D1/2